MLLFDFDVHNKVVPVWIIKESLTAKFATGFIVFSQVNGRAVLGLAPVNI